MKKISDEIVRETVENQRRERQRTNVRKMHHVAQASGKTANVLMHAERSRTR